MPDRDSPLDRYLIEIRNKSSIAPNEADLLSKAKSGDLQVRKVLVESYLAITAEMGLRLARPSMQPMQALQEANLVLLRLIEAGASKPAAELGPAIDKHFASLT